MKPKIVKKVPTNDYLKTRTKAMKIAAGIPGTISTALEGRHKDQLVVVGDGVDVVQLTRQLRKKMGYTQLTSVQEVHENIEKKDEEGGGEKKDKGGGGSEKKDKPDDSEKKDRQRRQRQSCQEE